MTPTLAATAAHIPARTTAPPARLAKLVAAACFALWAGMIVWMVGALPRDGDQAAYLNGALALLRGDFPIWHAAAYNYDKQFLSYWLLACLGALVGAARIVLAANIAQAALLCAAGAAILLRTPLWRRTPAVSVPLVFAPVLVLSGGFFGTNTVSFCLLLLAYAALRRGRLAGEILCCALIAAAAGCRGDAILAVPALILYSGARRTLPGLLQWRFAWCAMAAAVLPLVIGHFISASETIVFAGFVLRASVIAAFLVFGLGVAATLLLPVNSALYVAAAVARPRFRIYYLLLAAAPLMPFGYYVLQLYTPRYFLTTLACLIFAICAPRARPKFAWLGHGAGRATGSALLAAVVLPWCIGVRAPDLRHISPAFTHSQEFPTAKGLFPMGAYFAYVAQAHGGSAALDHNGKIFLAALHADFAACHGAIPVLTTPMRDFLILAINVRGLAPRYVDGGMQLPCGFVYADQRSLLRTADLYRTDPAILSDAIETTANVDGQAILKLGTQPTALGDFLTGLKRRFAGHEFELRTVPAGPVNLAPFHPLGGLLIVASAKPCSQAPETHLVGNTYWSYWPMPPHAPANELDTGCGTPFAVQTALPVLPRYMGL